MKRLGQTDWQVLSPMLDLALDLSPEKRAEWLAGVRRDDPALAADLDELLSTNADLARDGFLEDSLLEAPLSLAGQSFGPWIVDSAIGEGGMGSVWLAHRSDGHYEGKAAIKFLNLALVGASGRERFKREGSILGRLSHPNIARLIDAGVSGAGQPYLVLEYVEGESLDAYCDSRGLDVAARLSLFLDVLAAVGDAHAHLIVHRDIKPSNVMVTRAGAVKLLDFGIAKLLDAGSLTGEMTALTRDGGNALTPQYAAPEQMLGEAVTTGTDVYALAVLLYVLLGGRHPLGRNTRSPAELSRAVVEMEPARLSDAVVDDRHCTPDELAANAARRASSPQKLQRMLQGDLDNIVAKGLKKKVRERYASASAFADDLRRYSDNQPVSARPDSIAYRTSKFVRRHRPAVIAGVLTLLAIVAGLAGTITQAQRAAAQAQRAQLERDHALRELTYAEAADEFMRFLLSDSSDKPFTTAELLARADGLVDKQFAGDAELRARLQLMIADLYGEVVEFKAAQAVLLRARDSAVIARNPSLSAQIDCTLAGLYSATGETARASGLFADAMQRFAQVTAPEPNALVDCLQQRSIHRRDLGDAHAALADTESALRYLGTPRPGQQITSMGLHGALADAYNTLGDYPRAAAAYDVALADALKMGRERTSAALAIANNLGVCLSRSGQLLRAATVYQRALNSAPADEAVTRHLLGTNYAKVLVELGREEEAARLFAEALESARRSENGRAIAFTALYAADGECVRGDLPRCAELLELGRRKLHEVLPPEHVIFGNVEITAARLALARHEPAAARLALQRALAIFDAATEPSPMRIRALSMLAGTQQSLGDTAAARAAADQAVAGARAALRGFEHSEWLGSALLARGAVLRQTGDQAGARASLREASEQLTASVGAEGPAARNVRRLLQTLELGEQ